MNIKLVKLWATKNKDDEWWSSFLSSPLAIAINYCIADIKWITPNSVTLLSFVTAIISVVFIILGGATNFVIAAILINVSYVFDCMDGQLARYRKTMSLTGELLDKLTDQIQVFMWFGAISYAAYLQSQSILPVFLAFVGVSFYCLRGYVKYVVIYTKMSKNNAYLSQVAINQSTLKKVESAGIGFGLMANCRWLFLEQRKIIEFNEGVFVFMLSASLLLNIITQMLWVFAISQLWWALYRSYESICKIDSDLKTPQKK